MQATTLEFQIVSYRPHIVFYCIFCVESFGTICANGQRRFHSEKDTSLCVKSPPVSKIFHNYLNYFSRDFLYLLNFTCKYAIYGELFAFEMHSETLKFVLAQNFTISCVVVGAGGVKYTTVVPA